jgi:hypothetical protein
MNTVGYDHMSPNEFMDAIRVTPPGDTFVYFTGDLSRALHALRRMDNATALRTLASLALAACERGDILLTQRRVGESMFEYRATVKRKRPKPPLTVEPQYSQSRVWGY